MLRVLLVIFNFFKFKLLVAFFLLLFVIIYIGYVVFGNMYNDDKKNKNDKIKQIMEWAYIEGQKDALEGDIRIKKLNDSTYVKTKSLWD